MNALLLYLIRRFRPRIGWFQGLLALAAALCPAFAAADSPLRLPAGVFWWAGLLGLLVGMRAPSARRPTLRRSSGRATDPSPPRFPRSLPVGGWSRGRAGDRRPRDGVPYSSRFTLHASRFTFYVLRFTFYIFALLLGALFVVAVADALPPSGLIAQDVVALWNWAAALRADASAGWPAAGRTWAFLGQALPRVWRDLLAAPHAGEKGARLLVASGGAASTWIGAITLGWALARRRALLGPSLPLLAALASTTILGGGTGLPLIVGVGLLLLLAIAADVQRREAAWDRAGVDFSDELKYDVLLWGSVAVGATLAVALLLPAWFDNPIANALWRDVETPSGLAVLERNIQHGQRGPPVADPGISKLPALELGLSLEQEPPDTVALRVRLPAPSGGTQPLPAAPWPRYWRARVFDRYNGREWTADARVSPLEPIAPDAGAFPGAILQDIEDTRADRQLIFALPDAIAVSVPANVERLPDGAAAALTEREPAGRYRVLSRPQELASPPPESQPPPDMRGYLALPSNLPPKIGETARVIAGENTSAYDQALALETYLRALRYDYQVQPLPRDGDAVYQFLFEMRYGYCTYYASAMAVMARSLGIPARVATGYATGAYDQTSGAYIVREADAHAWPELYINGRWLPFEPTPIRALPARSTSDMSTPVVTPVVAQQPANLRGPLIWLAMIVLVGLLTAVGIWLGRRALPAPLVVRVQMLLERSGARAGVPWPAGATLHEYGALLEPLLDGAGGALQEIIELIEQARYGGRDLHDDEQRRLRVAGERVWAQLRRGNRRV
jgi:transglutaminase-like putative cysteine protease